jgi:hypothetical protein
VNFELRASSRGFVAGKRVLLRQTDKYLGTIFCISEHLLMEIDPVMHDEIIICGNEAVTAGHLKSPAPVAGGPTYHDTSLVQGVRRLFDNMFVA